jgi:dihydrofolate reductase
MLTGIVTISQDGVIGHHGKIPWHIPEDLQFFKETTYGSAVIMGRKTYESLRHPLDYRLNVVLSKEGSITGVVTRITKPEEAKPIIDQMKSFVIGGTAVYTEFSRQITDWIITRVPTECGLSDTYFPEVLLDHFSLAHTHDIPCKNGMTLTVQHMVRVEE